MEDRPPSPPHHHHSLPAAESTSGRSYMMWTIGTAVLSVVCVVVENQQPGSTASRVLIAVIAPLVLLANMLGIALLLLREWTNIQVTLLPLGVRRVRWRLPWRMLHIIDHYLALGAAWALLLMVLWVWDDSAERTRYFEFDYAASRKNAWAGWLTMLGIVFHIIGGVGVQPIVHHPVSEALTVALTVVADLTKILLFALVAGEGYALAKEETQRRKHRKTSGPGRPEKAGDSDASSAQELEWVVDESFHIPMHL
jgi:hypothetical protein